MEHEHRHRIRTREHGYRRIASTTTWVAAAGTALSVAFGVAFMQSAAVAASGTARTSGDKAIGTTPDASAGPLVTTPAGSPSASASASRTAAARARARVTTAPTATPRATHTTSRPKPPPPPPPAPTPTATSGGS